MQYASINDPYRQALLQEVGEATLRNRTKTFTTFRDNRLQLTEHTEFEKYP